MAVVLFSLFTTIGIAYTGEAFSGRFRPLKIAISLVGNGVLAYVLLVDLLALLDRKLGLYSSSRFEPRMWLVASAIVLAGWLPFLLGFFPGNIPYDGVLQMRMALGDIPLTSHHPVLSTLVIGFFLRVGMAVGLDYMGGVFLFVGTQALVCAMIFGYLCALVRQVSSGGFWATVVFFAVVPMWGAWATVLGKDALYYAFFALFCAKVCQWALSRYDANFPWRSLDYLVLFCASFLILAFRKDGMFVVLSTLFVMLLFDRRPIAFGVAGATVVMVVVLSVSTSVVAEKSTQPFELLSVPFQQTARLVVEHGNELSEAEKTAIDQVLILDTLSDRYNPINADPVKDLANRAATNDELTAYLGAWASLGLKYPKTYLSAFLNHSFGYYYPFFVQESLSDIKLYLSDAEKLQEQWGIAYGDSPTLLQVRGLLFEWVSDVRAFPVLSLLMTCGTYTWCLLVVGLVLWRTGRKDLLVPLIAPLICLAVATFSPVNAYLRYMMPIMGSMPVLLALARVAFARNLTQLSSRDESFSGVGSRHLGKEGLGFRDESTCTH